MPASGDTLAALLALGLIEVPAHALRVHLASSSVVRACIALLGAVLPENTALPDVTPRDDVLRAHLTPAVAAVVVDAMRRCCSRAGRYVPLEDTQPKADGTRYSDATEPLVEEKAAAVAATTESSESSAPDEAVAGSGDAGVCTVADEEGDEAWSDDSDECGSADGDQGSEEHMGTRGTIWLGGLALVREIARLNSSPHSLLCLRLPRCDLHLTCNIFDAACPGLFNGCTSGLARCLVDMSELALEWEQPEILLETIEGISMLAVQIGRYCFFGPVIVVCSPAQGMPCGGRSCGRALLCAISSLQVNHFV